MEDEYHFLNICPAYQEKRCSLLDYLEKEYRIKISRMSPNKIFMFLINPPGIIKLGSCHKHGTKIEDVLAFFSSLNRVRVPNPQRLTHTQILVKSPSPPPDTHTLPLGRLIDCLQSAFFLKICLVLIPSSAIANSLRKHQFLP